MTEYHTVYKDVPGTTTEWEDLQVKFGNLPARPKPERVSYEAPAEEPRGRSADAIAATASVDELEELEDECGDDRFLEEYRMRRMAELRTESARPRFTSVELIAGTDFVREVSKAPEDVWVVVHLFKDRYCVVSSTLQPLPYVQDCSVLQACLNDLAAKYTETKFLRIVSTDCIVNYPDSNLPTVLVYKGGVVKATLLGLSRFGGRRCTPEDVAFQLCQFGPVLTSPGLEASSSQTAVAMDYIRRMVAQREAEENEDTD
eukprot:SM000251S08832  [mRNA]  locus=s251:133513:134790:- [translate_table: standard]